MLLTKMDKKMIRYFPEGIDILFENVGGAMLDAVQLNTKKNGRIAVCGMTSQYNLEKAEGVYNLLNVVVKSIRMVGFQAFDHCHIYPKFVKEAHRLIKEGKIKYMEDIVEGIENAPTGLFKGRNVGKQVVVIAPE